jgi:hypothetical protein
MAIERIDDHVTSGILKLIPPFWGKPRITAGLQGFLLEVQELEDVIFDFMNARLLGNATGWSLKMLGKIVGQQNHGWSDELFRTMIRARIRANRSTGKIKDVLAVAHLIFGGSTPIAWLDLGWAGLRLIVPGIERADTAIPAKLLLPITRAAGVGLELVTNSQDADRLLGYSVSDLPASGTRIGWGTVTDSSVGGYAWHVERI